MAFLPILFGGQQRRPDRWESPLSSFGQQLAQQQGALLAQQRDQLAASLFGRGFDMQPGQMIPLESFSGGLNQMGSTPRPGLPDTHFGQVKHFRKEFKKYSKEEFRDMSKEPVIKDILTGTHKMNAEEMKDRIQEHVDELVGV